MTLQALLAGSIFQFLLVFARLGSAMMLLPGFGEAYVAIRVRLVFAVALSLAAMPLVMDRLPALPAQPAELAMVLIGEMAIGAMFGTMCRLLLLALLSAGMVVALQAGIANALSVDPTTAQQGAVSGNFLLAVGLVLIFATGLDHTTLQALVGTYVVFPPGQFPAIGDVSEFVTRTVADSFDLALRLAAPFLVLGMVFAVAMGLLARLMPTLQVFFVIMPLQVLAGLGLLAVSLSGMMLWFLDSYEAHLSPFLGG